jgi:3-oxoacyl-(acyl-carrier-protein) synthase
MSASGAAAAIMHSVSLAHARQAQISYTILVDGTASAAASLRQRWPRRVAGLSEPIAAG